MARVTWSRLVCLLLLTCASQHACLPPQGQVPAPVLHNPGAVPGALFPKVQAHRQDQGDPPGPGGGSGVCDLRGAGEGADHVPGLSGPRLMGASADATQHAPCHRSATTHCVQMVACSQRVLETCQRLGRWCSSWLRMPEWLKAGGGLPSHPRRNRRAPPEPQGSEHWCKVGLK